MSTAKAVSRLDRSMHFRQEQIANEIGALVDLDLTELGARWLKVTGRPAPTAFRTEMLRRALAYEMQVAVFGGGLPASLKRHLRDLARAAREDRFDEALGTTHLKPGTLLMRVWGYSSEIRTRTLDVHVRRLRKKLGAYADRYIETIFGVGYRFQPFHAPRFFNATVTPSMAIGA